jgi:2-C-methyl-D-erythritol 4-phosphate cytidylyltransferase
MVPAAGTGSRMRYAPGSSIPKQYLPLAGRPMIAHALLALARVALIEKVFVVLAADDAHWEQFDFAEMAPKLEVLRCGGETRAMTVSNGLDAISRQADRNDWILVHDAARPCVTSAQIEELISRCVADSQSVGGLLATPVADTLKMAGPAGTGAASALANTWQVAHTVPRAGLWQAQTPQMFRHGQLRKALAQAPQVTDEASAIEALGCHPQLVESDATNLKVTYPCDQQLAEMILMSRAKR